MCAAFVFRYDRTSFFLVSRSTADLVQLDPSLITLVYFKVFVPNISKFLIITKIIIIGNT